MVLTLMEKKAVVGFASFVVGVLWLRRAFASGKGEVFIDKVSVQKADYTPADESAAVLSALQRQAMETLGVDLDLIAPTNAPTPLQTLDIEQTIGRLRAAGRAGDADFLAQLLHEAQGLQPSISGRYPGEKIQRGGLYAYPKWNTRPDHSTLQLGQRVRYYQGKHVRTGILTERHSNGAAWAVTGKQGAHQPERTETIYTDQIKAVEEPG